MVHTFKKSDSDMFLVFDFIKVKKMLIIVSRKTILGFEIGSF